MDAFKQWAEALEQRAQTFEQQPPPRGSSMPPFSTDCTPEEWAEQDRIIDVHTNQFKAWWVSRGCIPTMYVDAVGEFMDQTFGATPRAKEPSK